MLPKTPLIDELQKLINAHPEVFWHRNRLNGGHVVTKELESLIEEAKRQQEWSFASIIQDYLVMMLKNDEKHPNEVLQMNILSQYGEMINIPIRQVRRDNSFGREPPPDSIFTGGSAPVCDPGFAPFIRENPGTHAFVEQPRVGGFDTGFGNSPDGKYWGFTNN